jgi:hypothetical protein
MLKRKLSLLLASESNDLGSGSNVDVCIIRMDGTVDYRRNDIKPNEIAPLRNAIQHLDRLRMPVGVTPILHETVHASSRLGHDDVGR